MFILKKVGGGIVEYIKWTSESGFEAKNWF